MYLALHIADAEVSRLASALAKLDRTTKTEAVRRAPRQSLAERRREAKRKGFREFAQGLVAAAREQRITPVTLFLRPWKPEQPNARLKCSSLRSREKKSVHAY